MTTTTRCGRDRRLLVGTFYTKNSSSSGFSDTDVILLPLCRYVVWPGSIQEDYLFVHVIQNPVQNTVLPQVAPGNENGAEEEVKWVCDIPSGLLFVSRTLATGRSSANWSWTEMYKTFSCLKWCDRCLLGALISFFSCYSYVMVQH